MKIAFVQTPAPYLVRHDAQMPLGILYLATMLKNYMRHDVQIFRPRKIEDIDPAIDSDVVCFSATTLEYPMTRECAMYIREHDRHIKILLGGTHVTATKTRNPMFDSICIGEGEYKIQQMISDIERNELHKYYESEHPINIDAIPFPDRSLIPGSHGGEIFSKDGEGRNENIITSRGCPFKCSFCATTSIWGNQIRWRALDNIELELKSIRENTGIRTLRLSDDSVTSNKNRLIQLCELFKKYGFVWRASVRAEDLTKELCEKMYDGGCREISPGIESGDQRVLDYLNKKTTLQKMKDGCANAKAAGIRVRALFIIGTPGERENTPELNMEYIKNLSFNSISLSTFIPFPGSPIYNDPDKFNCEILSKDFRTYNKNNYIRNNGNAYARKYAPLIHNKFLTIGQMIENVWRMEKYIDKYEVHTG